MAMSFDMDGAIAVIAVRGELSRDDLPNLEEYLNLARQNEALAVLVDVTAVPRVPTSVLGALLRHSKELRASGTLVGLVGHDAVRNPVVPPGFLAGKVPVFADAASARVEIRRRSGGALAPAAD